MRRAARTLVATAVLGTLVAVAFAGNALAQSSSGSASPSGSQKITFIEGTLGDLGSVNPFKALTTTEYEVLSLNFDMLENFDKANLTAAPGLATKWTNSSDDLTWTFDIRNDAKWQDGQPLTAKDIAFTYNLILKCQLGNSLNYLVPDFTKTITAPSDTQLVWTLKKPTIAPIRPPWVYIIPEHIWGSSSCHDINTAKFFTDGQPMVGSGPFQLTGWDKGQNWTMTANPDYWGGAPHIDQFIVKKFSNAEDLVTALKTGTIDYSQSISVRLFDQLAKENGANGITTHIGPETTFDQMSFNMCDPTAAYTSTYCKSTGSTGNPALRDPVVRQAISWAIDRKTLVDKVLAGYGSPGTTVVPPFATTFHYDPPADQQYGFDINKANAMLDAAGYKDTDGDGIRNMKGGGANLDFRLILRSDSDISADLGQYISGWLSQIGIATKKSVLTDGKLEQAWLANDYDMYIWGWGPDPDPDFILSTFTSGQCGSWSDTCFSNKQYDQLYLAQQTAKTPEDRIKIVDQMQGILYQQVPEMVLMYDNSLEAYNSNKWTGLEDNISPQPEGSLWNQYTPYTALTIRPVGSGGSSSSGGISPIVWIGAIAIVGIGAAGFIASSKRRAKNEDDLA